jgi:hypothetical protein
MRACAEDATLQGWLDEALDREGHFADTHPTLRARLAALAHDATSHQLLPPALGGASAAQAWFGVGLSGLRAELQAQWASDLAEPWSQRFSHVQGEREQLAALRALESRDAEQEREMLRLTMNREPDVDLRDALAALNTANPDHAVGLFLEAVARLKHDERDGLALFERAVALDPDATGAACERAHAWLSARGEDEQAEAWAERWRMHAA